jgi:hypothetical protein
VRVYTADKAKFIHHVTENIIADEIRDAAKRILGHSTGMAEFLSWQNSLQFMKTVVEDPAIPEDAGVAIEYTLPYTRRRVDFILTGTDDAGTETAVLIELKWW